MKQKTAVQWLAEQMLHPNIFNPYIEEALIRERQQIIDSHLAVMKRIRDENDLGELSKEDIKEAENYFNQTFEKS